MRETSVDTRDALATLGLAPGADLDAVRAAFRRLVRTHHPDVAGPGSNDRTARLTEAYRVLKQAADADGIVAGAPPPPPEPPPAPTAPPGPGVDAHPLGGDALVLDAPPDEAYLALFDAAARLGHIAYFDRGEGIIETIVRFEGGPSCSVLITLQGRAHGTEAFCTMDSIEAAPTPPLAPVVDALAEELRAAGAGQVRGREPGSGQDGRSWA